MKRIGCFHAHYSNIEHIEGALRIFDVELIHFVDPGLDRKKTDDDFTNEIAEKKVTETLEWIVKCHVDAILVTCTFFTVMIREELHRFPVPIIKIDDPLFHDICKINKPIVFVFTNPNTVEGTMKRLSQFSENKGKMIQVETRLIPNSFELIMQGKRVQYTDTVAKGLVQIVEETPDKYIVAAQLSMVPAALKVEQIKDVIIGNQLVSLASYMKDILSLELKS